MRHVEMDTMELELSDDYFEMTALKSAVYAYLVDHANAVPGGLRAWLVFKDEEDFWRRVRARKYGDYRVKDQLSLRDKAAAKQKRLRELEIGFQKGVKKQRRFDKLKNGTPIQVLRWHLATRLRQWANVLAGEKAGKRKHLPLDEET